MGKLQAYTRKVNRSRAQATDEKPAREQLAGLLFGLWRNADCPSWRRRVMRFVSAHRDELGLTPEMLPGLGLLADQSDDFDRFAPWWARVPGNQWDHPAPCTFGRDGWRPGVWQGWTVLFKAVNRPFGQVMELAAVNSSTRTGTAVLAIPDTFDPGRCWVILLGRPVCEGVPSELLRLTLSERAEFEGVAAA